MVKGISHYILVAIWITMMTSESEIQPLFNKLSADFDEPEVFIYQNVTLTALCFFQVGQK